MFTLEINGVAVAMTDADEAEARDIFLSDDFKEDLASFTTDGKAIWDGKAPLVIRAATEDESELFDEAMDDEDFDDEDLADEADDDEGDELDEDGPSIMFLLDVDQFADDED